MNDKPTATPAELVIEAGRTERHYWADLWRYRELLGFLAWRDIKVRYQQTLLGAACALVQPLASVVIFTFVFGRLAKMPSGNEPYFIVVINAAAGWHATCGAEAEDIRRLGFRQPICVAPNGVESASTAVEAEEADHWRTCTAELIGKRVALFYSRFHAKKRLIELIDLWLSPTRGDWLLLIVGIPEEFSVDQLNAYIFKNGGCGRIIVRDGAGQPPPYAAANLFLLPSHSENFGLVVVEALVRGVPVLTTDSTPWQELKAVGAGHCVAWSDYGSALDSLLAQSPEELTASGLRGRQWASAMFSWDKSARTLVDFYASLSHTA